VRYNNVPFELVNRDVETRLSGMIPRPFSELEIDPGLLPAPSDGGEAPVRIEMTWRRDK
jgi:hypothetical protein